MFTPLILVMAQLAAVPATKVTVDNQCPGTLTKFLGNVVTVKLPADKKYHHKTGHIMGAAEGDAYAIIICTDTTCMHYGNMTFLRGKEYNVTVSQCNLPSVRIESHEVGPKEISCPVSATIPPAQIRFRARTVGPTEYRYNASRFRRLSVGMSKYSELACPLKETKIQFRHRLTRGGPVSYLSSHELKRLRPGRKYYVEVKYFGGHKEAVKIQDEGLIEKRP